LYAYMQSKAQKDVIVFPKCVVHYFAYAIGLFFSQCLLQPLEDTWASSSVSYHFLHRQ
jgi:hypothetical protein